MKNVIVIVFTILLGMYIGNTLILGGDGSFKKGADGIVKTATTKMTVISGTD